MTKIKVIAEIGCNHMGDVGIAKEMIAEAKACGADFVKMQKRHLMSIPKTIAAKEYRGQHSFGTTYGEHRKALELKHSSWYKLRDHAESLGIGFFATPFDDVSLRFLHYDLRLKIIKYGSTQVHDEAMWKEWHELDGDTPKLILSTGMCDIKHVHKAVAELSPDVLMHTTSCYPCEETEVHLNAIGTMRKQRVAEIGLSGHYTAGNGAIEAAAVAMGATWIERHFTLDRSWKGTDQSASLEPEGLRNVVKAIRTVERAMGGNKKMLLDCEKATYAKIRGK